MNTKVKKFTAALSILTAIGSAAVAGYKIYSTYQELRAKKKEDQKLEERLVQSMEGSDATAVY